MRNLLLLLVLISGLLAGYLIGDYGAKKVRKELELVTETGKKLESERMATIAKLEMDLNSVNEKHKQELEKSRNEYASKAAEWQREKAGLNEKIKSLKAEYAKDEAELKKLLKQLNGATGTERAELERKIERLRIKLGLLSQQIEGNACLNMPVPQSVHEALALKLTNDIGGKR